MAVDLAVDQDLAVHPEVDLEEADSVADSAVADFPAEEAAEVGNPVIRVPFLSVQFTKFTI